VSAHDWEPGFRKHFPWFGFLAVMVIFGCMAGSVLVLLSSDNRSERHWHPRIITPSVWLSGFNNIANIAFAVAVGQ